MKKKSKIEEEDFGFPFIEVKPIHSEEILEIVQNKTDDVIINSISSEITTSSSTSPNQKEKSLNLFLIISFIIILLSVSTYFLIGIDSIKNLLNELPNFQQLTQVENPKETPEVIDNNTQKDYSTKVEQPESEEEITEGIEEEQHAIISITENVKSRYFLVVASLVSEKLAKAEAEKYFDEEKNIFIIHPYGNINNFRVAIAKFDNINDALLALEKAKKDINNSSWILKY